MSAKIKDFAENLWFQVEDQIVTVGVLEDALNSLEIVRSIHLVEEGESVESDQIVGDINSDDDSLNLYSPCSGEVIEVNEAILENPRLIYEDPTGESWLFRVKAEDEDELASLLGEEEDEDSDDDDDDDLDLDDDFDYEDADESDED